MKAYIKQNDKESEKKGDNSIFVKALIGNGFRNSRRDCSLTTRHKGIYVCHHLRHAVSESVSTRRTVHGGSGIGNQGLGKSVTCFSDIRHLPVHLLPRWKQIRERFRVFF
ncbi:MAG: hypothetical protein IMF13_06285 [Proteobacteria bacterium]|nr:hypothetical protein [Pseudomonadota bacterium]